MSSTKLHTSTTAADLQAQLKRHIETGADIKVRVSRKGVPPFTCDNEVTITLSSVAPVSLHPFSGMFTDSSDATKWYQVSIIDDLGTPIVEVVAVTQ